MLLDNQYVSRASGITGAAKSMKALWKSRFASGRRAVQLALAVAAHRRCSAGCSTVLSNQLIHGGATWNGSVDREQVRDCINQASAATTELRMDSRDTLWGSMGYPVVD